MAATRGNYLRGAPQRPSITHDNGHLDQFKLRPPTWQDRSAYAKWRLTLEAAEAAQGFGPFEKTHMPDALAAYRHFMGASGKSRFFSYERYVRNDNSGKTTIGNQITEAQNAALTLYSSSGAIANDSFDFTGSALGAGNNQIFPYPATENWQKAIGAYNFWISGSLGAEVKTPDSWKGAANLSHVSFELTLTVHVEDMYNFNTGGAADIATGIPDEDNGRFEITGLAKQYLNYSELQRTVRWIGSEIASYSHSAGDQIERLRRQRGPADARRARDRV
jgi:hypothetical protein